MDKYPLVIIDDVELERDGMKIWPLKKTEEYVCPVDGSTMIYTEEDLPRDSSLDFAFNLTCPNCPIYIGMMGTKWQPTSIYHYEKGTPTP